MSGLWRYGDKAPEGKYLVTRRDGTVPEWPYMVFGAKDPAAPAALRAYADEGGRLGYDPVFVADVRRLADEFESYCAEHGKGDPAAPPQRQDDPATLEKMRLGFDAQRRTSRGYVQFLRWMISKSTCFLVGHDRNPMPMGQVETEGWVGGVMRPWQCNRCGYQSFRAKYPEV